MISHLGVSKKQLCELLSVVYLLDKEVIVMLQFTSNILSTSVAETTQVAPGGCCCCCTTCCFSINVGGGSAQGGSGSYTPGK